MKYWVYAQVGVPLGSGVVTEAACKGGLHATVEAVRDALAEIEAVKSW